MDPLCSYLYCGESAIPNQREREMQEIFKKLQYVVPTVAMGIAATGVMGQCDPENLFGPYQVYDDDHSLQSATQGDLNGDGYLDLIVYNNFSEVSVLLNKSDGTFSTVNQFSAGNLSDGLVLGDLNGDGHLDLVFANPFNDDTSVLLGEGDGTFGNELRYPAGDFAESVALGDLDGDGHLDMAVANAGSDDLSILIGNGNGTFAPEQRYNAGDGPESISLGDIDDDGDLDIVVANLQGDDISILLNNGDGTFAAEFRNSTDHQPKSLALGDMDDDGKLDIIVANNGGDNISVMLNNGDGTFASEQSYGVGNTPRSVSVGDLDADGDLDIAVSNYIGNDTSILLNHGNGTFAPEQRQRFGEDLRPVTVLLGDLNGDQYLDMSIAHGHLGNMIVLMNQCIGIDLSLISSQIMQGPEVPSGYEFDLSYTLSNSTSEPVDVFLGASIRPAGSMSDDYIESPSCEGCGSDAVVTIPANTTSMEFVRCFEIPCGTDPGMYEVTYAIWPPDGPDCGPVPDSQPYDTITSIDLEVLSCLGDFVQLTTSLGGASLQAGSLVPLSWTTDPSINTNIEVQFSPDGGYSWQVLFEQLPNTGSFDWRVPTDFGDNCKIKLIGYVDSETHLDISDQFEIIPPIGSRFDAFSGTELDDSMWTALGTPGNPYTMAGGTASLENNADIANNELTMTVSPANPADKAMGILENPGDGIELQSVASDYLYGYYNARIWPVRDESGGAPNTTTAIFTLSSLGNDQPNDNWHEIDVEIIDDGNGWPLVSFVVWTRAVEANREVVDGVYIAIDCYTDDFDGEGNCIDTYLPEHLRFDPYDGYHDYGFVWTEDNISFFIDGKPAVGKLKSRVQFSNPTQTDYFDGVGPCDDGVRTSHIVQRSDFVEEYGVDWFPDRDAMFQINAWSRQVEGETEGGVARVRSVFAPDVAACSADLTGDGSLDFFDVSAFLSAFAASEPVADFTGDGSFDFFDVSAFLTAFGEGCP